MRIRYGTLFIALAFLGCSLAPLAAHAFWFGAAPSDDIQLKDAPNESGRTVETLSQGARFTATDQPSGGYYRVRTKSSTGYIDASLIDSQNPNRGAGAAPAPETTVAASQKRNKKRQKKSLDQDPKWSVNLLVGDTLSNPSDVSNALGTKSLADPLGLGLELTYRIAPSWRLAFRGEYLSKSLTGQNQNVSDNNTYQLDMKGYMLTVGADYFLSNTPRYDIFLGARAGLGIGKLSSVATNEPTPNETDFSGTTVAGTLELGLDYKLFSFLWLGLEGGYQLFSTSKLNYSTSSSANGAGIWPSPISLSYSGVFGNIGVRFVF
jgi:hypothetical protein